MLHLDDFPSIKIDSKIYHKFYAEHEELLKVGSQVKVEINIEHRIKSSIMHSATHIALMAMNHLFPDAYEKVCGCKITDVSGRLDFHIQEKITPEQLEKINRIANDIIFQNKNISVYPHEKSREAWYWKCDDYTIPCGGTHVPKTGLIGNMVIKRKNVGKGTERIIISCNNSKIDELKNSYHH
jgi:alanyl-tRNA synthetase